MRRREDHPLSKHTMNFYRGDIPKLMALYSTRVGAAKIVRDLVHAHIRLIEENAAQKLPITEELDFEEFDDA